MSNTALAFDTLQYSKKLREAGVPERQAEVQAEAIRELIDERLATKLDLKRLEENTKREILEVEERLNNKINELGYKITIRLGSLMVVGVFVLAALIKL